MPSKRVLKIIKRLGIRLKFVNKDKDIGYIIIYKNDTADLYYSVQTSDFALLHEVGHFLDSLQSRPMGSDTDKIKDAKVYDYMLAFGCEVRAWREAYRLLGRRLTRKEWLEALECLRTYKKGLKTYYRKDGGVYAQTLGRIFD